MGMLIRQWHRRIAWFAALPAAFILTTGMLLHLRRVIPWIQPVAQKATKTGQPQIAVINAFEKILMSEAVRQSANVNSWEDIKSVEYKPSLGVWSFKSQSYFEIQVDGQTGVILSAAPRRSLWLMQLHEGSWFGLSYLWLIFFPTGLLLVVLEGTGVYLLVDAWLKKRRRENGAG